MRREGGVAHPDRGQEAEYVASGLVGAQASHQTVGVRVTGAEQVPRPGLAVVGRAVAFGPADWRPPDAVVRDQLDRHDRPVGGRLAVERKDAFGLGLEVRVGAPLPQLVR